MFVLTTIVDTIRVPPELLGQPTLTAVRGEMEKRYPNRVIMDVGLVICLHGKLEVGDGLCVAGDGGAHFEVVSEVLVFRPFLNEVIVGTIHQSTEEGIWISLKFFCDIFIPAYWMLRPSKYEKETGLWVWTPNYNDEKQEEEEAATTETNNNNNDDNDDEDNRYEMDVGAEIRFKVKSIHFTQVTNTAKGVQATTTTTSKQQAYYSPMTRLNADASKPSSNESSQVLERPVRKRSSSVDLSDSSKIPASMHIVGSICEDGLGLVSWWSAPDEEEEEEEN